MVAASPDVVVLASPTVEAVALWSAASAAQGRLNTAGGDLVRVSGRNLGPAGLTGVGVTFFNGNLSLVSTCDVTREQVELQCVSVRANAW